MPSQSDNYTSRHQDTAGRAAALGAGQATDTAPPRTDDGPTRTDRELGTKGRNTRSRLLTAAVDVFEQRGYHATRVDDIVKVANTSHGTFYIYFTNKEDVFRALIADAARDLGQVAKSLGPLEPGDAGRADLRNWIGELASTYQRFAPVIRAWTEGAADDAEMRSSGIEMTKAFISTFADRIRSSPGTSLDPRSAAVTVVAMIERSFYYEVRSRDDQVSGTVLDTIAAIVHNGLHGTP